MIIKTMKYISRLAPVLSIGLLGGAVYFWNSPAREGPAGSGTHVEVVQLAQARKISLPAKLTVTAELQPKSQAAVVSRLAGKVIEVRFKVGDFVPAGALVATVHADELEQRLARIESNIEAAKQALRPREDELASAEKSLAQQREFLRGDLIARRDVEQAEIAVETARAQTELARAQLAQQEAMLVQVRGLRSLTRFYAPVGGQVIRTLVAPGARVGEDTAVLSIGTLDILKINLPLSDGALSAVRPDRDVEITAPALPGMIAKGKVIRFEPPKRDEGKYGGIEIEVINQEKKLRPGMLVEASFDLTARRRTSVSSAIARLSPRSSSGGKDARGNHRSWP